MEEEEEEPTAEAMTKRPSAVKVTSPEEGRPGSPGAAREGVNGFEDSAEVVEEEELRDKWASKPPLKASNRICPARKPVPMSRLFPLLLNASLVNGGTEAPF